MGNAAGAVRSMPTVDEAIEHIGEGRFQRRLLWVCGFTWAADAAEVLLIGFALPQVTVEFGLSALQAGAVATATFIGMLLGAAVWGSLSDRIGRRTGFQVTVVVFTVFGTLSAFAPDAVWLAGLRALTGFGLGGALPLDFSLYAEFLPSRNRGRRLVILESFWAVGTLAAAGLAWALLPTVGWRPLLASTAVVGLLLLWIRARVPESPRWLATVGRGEEAAAVLAVVARANGSPWQETEVTALRSHGPTRPHDLWHPSVRRSTTMLWIAWFGIALGYYGLLTWLPSVFVDQGFTFLAAYQSVFLLALAQVPGYATAAWLVERWGRKPTLGVYLAGAAGGTWLFTLATTTAGLVATAALMSFFALGAWGALYAYSPELYPTAIRATGVGWASGMSRIAGALAPLIGGLLLPVSLAAALIPYAAGFVVAGVAVVALGRETRGVPLID